MIDHDYETKLSNILCPCDISYHKIRNSVLNLMEKHFKHTYVFGYVPDLEDNIPFPDESETVKHLLHYASFTLNYVNYKDFLKNTTDKIKRFRSHSSLCIRNNILQVHRDFKTGDIIVQYFLRAWVVNPS